MLQLAVFGIEAAWAAVLTYLVHSTLWIAFATLLLHFHRSLSPSARHVVWRAALLGPLASSVCALGLGHRWQWVLTSAPAADGGWVSAASNSAMPSAHAVELTAELAGRSVLFSSEPAYTSSALLAACWALVALAGLLLLARAVHRQRRSLALRTLVTDATSIALLERLSRRAGLAPGVALSRCAQASSPLVLGSREICLPERADDLDAAALEAVLAHELAHIERRDGLWLYGAFVLQALFWFQPLNRRARAGLQESAELAADARAVELTGDALGLARTLTLVAGWLSAAEPAPLVAMARAGSPIVERVIRLVEASDARCGARRSARTPWLALAALAAIGACSPSIGAPRASALPAAAPSGAGVQARDEARCDACEHSAGESSGLADALASSQSIAELTLAEHELGERIRRIEQRLAAAGAPGTAQPELEGLLCEFAQTAARRLRLTRDFEARPPSAPSPQRAPAERAAAPRLDRGTRSEAGG